MFSAEVSVSCRREFGGGEADPRFIDLMPTPADLGATTATRSRTRPPDGAAVADLDGIAERLHRRRQRHSACRCCCRRGSTRKIRRCTQKKLSMFFPDWEDWPKTLVECALRRHLQRPDRVDARRRPLPGPIASTIASASRTRPSGRRCSPRDLLVKTFEYKDLSTSR